MKTYEEKLRDPRWQKKKSERLLFSDCKCDICTDGTETLHIHHPFYDGREPWDYAVEELMCVCESCHKLSHCNILKIQAFAKFKKLDIKRLSIDRLPSRMCQSIASECDEQAKKLLLVLEEESLREFIDWRKSLRSRRDAIWKASHLRLKATSKSKKAA